MNDIELNQAVAYAAGWMYHDGWHGPNGEADCLPDFCNDYNAIMPLVKTLDGTLKMKFIHTLGLDVLKICPLAGDIWMAQEYDCHQMLTATPRQLCEAYLAVGGADS